MGVAQALRMESGEIDGSGLQPLDCLPQLTRAVGPGWYRAGPSALRGVDPSLDRCGDVGIVLGLGP